LGLIVWQQDDLNYPSGFAAGRVVAAHPELGRTNLVEAAKIDLTGPKNGFSLDIQSLLKDREFLVAVSAFSENGEPVDLTDRVVQGKLTWDVPAGKWRLFVTKSVPSEPLWTAGPGPMPMVDFMNPKAVDAFIQTIYQATYDQLGSEFGRTFKGFFSDEAPVMFTQYTPDFLERFEKAKGYSLRPYLPCLLNDLSKIDRKVRVDYRDFIREQNTTVFYGRSRKWCNEHGIQLIGHVIEDHQQDMRRLECLDFPGMDEVSDQWYQPSQDVYWRIARMVSSVAHYGGSRNDIALIEHFAATGWQTGLTEMKRMMDWSTVMGLNQIVPCGLATQDPPDWEVTPEFWLHGKNPQWPYFPAYQAAANRMTMLMRGGRHVAPAIMLDDTESRWPSQPLTSKIDHSNDDLWKSCRAVNLAHVDFDLIPYYVFSDAARTCFDKATIRIGKEDYKAVILTGVDSIPAAVAERLREFYDAGGIVVALNHVPTNSVNGQEDDRVRAAVDAIWGKTASGRGKSAVVKDDDLTICLTSLNVPDVVVDPALKSLLYYHRRLHGKDLYFFVNTAQEPIDTTVELHGVGPAASRWDPSNGEISDLPCISPQAGVTTFPLTLGEYESVFVVVEQSKNPATAAPSPKLVRQIEVKNPWTVKNEVDENHRLFSTVAKLPDDWPVHSPASLELHGATEILSVTLNGKPVGMRFCAPYRFDISELLVPGDNRLEVLRVGRIVLPMGNEWMYKILKTPHDADDKTPCDRATISY
jgi:hypothetical protein